MGEIVTTYIEDEMKRSYIDYAMSVIVGRALPDVRDGLKPVHRRILFAMKELGLTHNRSFRKSATVVGEVLGKYHPHGDASVYDTMVRMVQSFSLRYPLVMGQGNFGSIDGDSAAAYRYTEAKLAEIAEFMLKDIEKEVVPLVPNFDNRLKEPSLLPSQIPNLLVNGSSGIAVGMATNVPPHNMCEIVDALTALMADPDMEDFSGIVKGPDFPTGGVITGKGPILEAYRTGRGKIKLKAQIDIEEMKNGREMLCVTEIPYQVNKTTLITEIAECVKHRKVEGISDLRDESDRDGIRIVIELKHNAPSQIVLNQLLKHTLLKTTFGINLLVLKNGQPQLLSLRELLVSYLDHRFTVVTKRTEFELNEAEERAHILEGLKTALDHIDEIIKVIRKAKNEEEAKNGLSSNFDLSDRQVKAILNMRLSRLVGLEREKIDQEYVEKTKLIEKLKKILSSKETTMEVIKEELLEVRKKFGDKRRTRIVEDETELEIEDLIPNVPVLIVLTQKGYVKRSKPGIYTRQHRGGIGVIGINLVPEDSAIRVIETLTHSVIVILTNLGRCYSVKGYMIPGGERSARGRAISHIVSLTEGETIKEILPLGKEGSVVIITEKGIIKKLGFSRFEKIRSTGIIAISLRKEDKIASATEVNENDFIYIATKKGRVIKFPEKALRSLSRTARGVKGIKLTPGDSVVSIKAAPDNDKTISLLVITPKGYGKRVGLPRFRTTHRAGMGVIGSKTGISDCEIVSRNSEVLIFTKKGQTLRTKANTIRRTGRLARGVRIVNLRGGDSIANVCKISEVNAL
jgi:DNA gyrase subunit A